MSWYTKEKAKLLLKRKLVKKEDESDNYIYFKVKDYNVTYDKRKKYWNCGCPHGSLWKGNKDEECYHCRACMMYLENEKRTKT